MYTVYRVTNLVNGNYYVGVHKTNVPNDGYLGSGNLINLAIRKYGIENFEKEILFIFENSVEAYQKEKELVVPNSIDPRSYNLNVGGFGGWDYAKKRMIQKLKDDPDFRSSYRKKLSMGALRLGRKITREHKEILRNRFLGERKSQESVRKSSESRIGMHPSTETKLKQSKAKIGKTHTEETKRKCSDANRGKLVSEETKKKLREAASKRDPLTYKGKSKTEEEKAKLREYLRLQRSSGLQMHRRRKVA